MSMKFFFVVLFCLLIYYGNKLPWTKLNNFILFLSSHRTLFSTVLSAPLAAEHCFRFRLTASECCFASLVSSKANTNLQSGLLLGEGVGLYCVPHWGTSNPRREESVTRRTHKSRLVSLRMGFVYAVFLLISSYLILFLLSLLSFSLPLSLS